MKWIAAWLRWFCLIFSWSDEEDWEVGGIFNFSDREALSDSTPEPDLEPPPGLF